MFITKHKPNKIFLIIFLIFLLQGYNLPNTKAVNIVRSHIGDYYTYQISDDNTELSLSQTSDLLNYTIISEDNEVWNFQGDITYIDNVEIRSNYFYSSIINNTIFDIVGSMNEINVTYHNLFSVYNTSNIHSRYIVSQRLMFDMVRINQFDGYITYGDNLLQGTIYIYYQTDLIDKSQTYVTGNSQEINSLYRILLHNSSYMPDKPQIAPLEFVVNCKEIVSISNAYIENNITYYDFITTSEVTSTYIRYYNIDIGTSFVGKYEDSFLNNYNFVETRKINPDIGLPISISYDYYTPDKSLSLASINKEKILIDYSLQEAIIPSDDFEPTTLPPVVDTTSSEDASLVFSNMLFFSLIIIIIFKKKK